MENDRILVIKDSFLIFGHLLLKPFFITFGTSELITMIKFLKLIIILTVLTGTNEFHGQDQLVDFDKNFTHVVYFYLNDPDDPEDRLAFENSLKKFLDNSLYAKTKFIGIPAKTIRNVVDNLYTYSLILTFPSKEIQNKYQDEPAHLVFIEESSHLWKSVKVYDSVGIY